MCVHISQKMLFGVRSGSLVSYSPFAYHFGPFLIQFLGIFWLLNIFMHRNARNGITSSEILISGCTKPPSWSVRWATTSNSFLGFLKLMFSSRTCKFNLSSWPTAKHTTLRKVLSLEMTSFSLYSRANTETNNAPSGLKICPKKPHKHSC